MWRKTVFAAGGLFSACVAAYLVPATGSQAQQQLAQQQSASFDARWLAVGAAQKGDRIDGPKATSDGQMYFFERPTVQTTVVVKGNRKPSDEPAAQTDGSARPQNGSMRKLPIVPVRMQRQDIKQEDKIPVGCESSFSPVTTPVMANVSARCVS